MNLKQAASIILVSAMLFTGAVLNNMEVIFPEISALAIGAWAMNRSPWQSRRINLWLSPTLAAFTGMALLKFFPYHPFLMITVAFILVLVELKLLNSDVYPSISAAILPIIVHADSWFYPIAVGVLTAVVLCGNILFERFAHANPALVPGQNNAAYSENGLSFTYWVKVFVIVAAVAAAAVISTSIYILAPPLIVVFIEMTQPKGALRKKGFNVLLLVALAAFSGVFWKIVTAQLLHLPLWICGIAAMVWLFFLYNRAGIILPPAGALTLLPVIVPADKLFLYPFQVTIGCAIFIALAAVAFNTNEFESVDGLGQEETGGAEK